MKKLVALLLAVLMVLGLVACAAKEETPAASTGTPQTEEPVKEEVPEDEEETGLSGEIVFATTFNNVADTTIKALAEQFMEENPGTKITIQAIGDAEQELPIMMAGDALPDIAPLLNNMSIDDLAAYFQPLDGMFTEDELMGYSTGVGSDGHLYGLNSSVSSWGMVYNKAVFEEAGITEVPLTVDDFMAACEKIKAIGVVPLASNFKDVWPLGGFTKGIAYAFDESGNVYNDAEDSPELLVEGNGLDFALKLVQEMYDKGYLEPDIYSTNWEGSKNDMAAGRVAMMPLASWLPQQIVDLGADLNDIGMFPYPGTNCLIVSGNWRYGVSKNSANPELAMAFLKWMWDDGRFMEATGIDCPLASYVSDAQPWLNELKSFGYPTVSGVNNSDKVNAIMSEAEYDFDATMVQDYIVAADKDAFVADVNARWSSAQ